MIKVVIEKRPSNVLTYHFYENEEKLKLKDGLRYLIYEQKFRNLITKLLKDVPFKSYIWKITAINRKEDINRKDKYFKFSVQDSPKLYNRISDSRRFDEYLEDSRYDLMSSDNKEKALFSYFKSLSGNYMLVPKDIGDKKAYVHFSNFMRYGPKRQIDEFWKIFALKILKNCKSDCKLYINTHGLDVPWLHVRFDIVPDKIVWKKSIKKN